MTGRLRIPSETEPHACCWLAFPYLEAEWPHNLAAAQREFASLCRGIAEEGAERVRLLVRDDRVRATARDLIGESSGVDYLTADYGDCWLRDTVPLLGHTQRGELGALSFRFNGWGGKFMIDGDEAVGDWVTRTSRAKVDASTLVLEGGALEFDGAGMCLTTESCALNPNRNPGATRRSVEEELSRLVDLDRVVWLTTGLEHDHTDGHVDMVARFAARGRVVTTAARRDDPNFGAHGRITAELAQAGLTLILLPSPGRIAGAGSAPLPANYCNFYVANEAVFVPQYGVAADAEAVRQIGEAFAGRSVVGLPARELLWGGGAFHCVTQPQPVCP
ncbi:MAG: agmatine deiminase family protein [Myxococcota bacterium]